MTEKKRCISYIISFTVLALSVILLFIWNINSGSVLLSLREIWSILMRPADESTASRIIWDIRLPRIPSPVPLFWGFPPGQNWWFL